MGNGMTVLVTGANGLVGSALRKISKGSLYSDLSIYFTTRSECDLTRFDQVLDLLKHVKPESILHLAGRVRGIGGNLGSQYEGYIQNLLTNTNVIEAGRAVGVANITAMGSAAMYPDLGDKKLKEEHIWLGPPHGSEYGYSLAKRGMLGQLELLKEQAGITYTCLLSTNIYGENDRFNELVGHVVPSLISKFVKGKLSGAPVEIWGSGLPKREFVYSEDVARLLLFFLFSPCGPINVAPEEPITIKELAEKISLIVGHHDYFFNTSKPDGHMARYFCTEKLRLSTSFEFTPLNVGLERTVNWFSRNINDVRY